jgi:hypothetical protein
MPGLLDLYLLTCNNRLSIRSHQSKHRPARAIFLNPLVGPAQYITVGLRTQRITGQKNK